MLIACYIYMERPSSDRRSRFRSKRLVDAKSTGFYHLAHAACFIRTDSERSRPSGLGREK
ncbi:hypothetical protein GCM10007362_21970 [Saccharibacillus endophyticus]|uniref:Uncharacterized protein n=1 Tax=Saccharibacillus endophyticus TaxID=2060666 RepID=A0ABQ1ZS20_9BACL|nr:hypothetical protein GCM10007362_21970 [Saccharibacillus endophyticus]